MQWLYPDIGKVSSGWNAVKLFLFFHQIGMHTSQGFFTICLNGVHIKDRERERESDS